MAHDVETIIIGGGQAGLSLSYHLCQEGREHVILERADQPAEAWRNHRWDSFTLVSPNRTLRIPGAEYQGDDLDGFLPRAEVVRYFEDYVRRFDLPIRYGVEANEVAPNNGGYRVRTRDGALTAANVVIATGLYQAPKIPPYAETLPPGILQLHCSQYRNPQQLQPGGVLVVGSGQSGCQIAEELLDDGRTVWLSLGGAGRAPRRYRGREIMHWLEEIGFFETPFDQLPPGITRFSSPPLLSGTKGGHSLNVHVFARHGARLLGRNIGGADGTLYFAPDLRENLTRSDQFEQRITQRIDGYVAANGLDVPEETLPVLRDGYDAEEILELDLRAAGITNVIWARGFNYDFSLVKLPVLDEVGYPIQQRGVTRYPGLYFLGMHILYKIKSGLLLGVGEDAQYVASHIVERTRRP